MDLLGLPLHPLVVHAAVVLIPLAALGTLAVLVWRPARERYGWLVVAFAVAGAGAAVLARVSGEALSADLGGGGAAVAAHRAWGELAPYPAVALALLLPAALLLRERSTGLRWASAALAGVGALAALVLVVLTGHSGATAVWGR